MSQTINWSFYTFENTFWTNNQWPTKNMCLVPMVKSCHWWVSTILCSKEVFGDLHFPLVLLVAVAGPKCLLRGVLLIEFLIRFTQGAENCKKSQLLTTSPWAVAYYNPYYILLMEEIPNNHLRLVYHPIQRKFGCQSSELRSFKNALNFSRVTVQ